MSYPPPPSFGSFRRGSDLLRRRKARLFHKILKPSFLEFQILSRLTNRIAKLEAETDRQTLDAQTMLVEVLARRDALWWPGRGPSKSNEGHIVERRKVDRAGRYGVSAKSSGRSEWGTAMDLRNSLIAQGLCKPTRSAGGEVSGLAITARGEADARALVGDRLANLGDRITQLIVFYLKLRKATSKGNVLESLLWQRTLSGYANDWDHLTEMVLPLLTAGVVEATRDTVGRVYYRLAMEAGYPEVIESRLEPIPEMDEIYVDAFRSEINMLVNLPRCDEIFIPLPASIGLHEFYPDDHDPLFESKRDYIDQIEAVLGNYGPFDPDDSDSPTDSNNSEVNNGN